MRQNFQQNPPPDQNVENAEETPEGRTDTAPSLFTQPETSLYFAEAICAKECYDTAYNQAMQEEQEEMARLVASRGRKRELPAPSGSNKEPEAPRKTITDNQATSPTSSTSQSTTSASNTPSQPSPGTDLKHFITALAQAGLHRNPFMHAIAALVFYWCHGYYLYHKYGPCDKGKRGKHQASQATIDTWKDLELTVPQDVYAKLLSLQGRSLL